MKKYAKIINKETNEVRIGTGTNTEFYKSIGMTEMDVEKAYDNNWYLVGYAPKKPQSIKEEEIRAIRDSMINSMSWRIERTNEQERLGIPCEDNSITLLIYKQYLRDYPESSEDWYEREPMTYEEWLVENKKKKN